MYGAPLSFSPDMLKMVRPGERPSAAQWNLMVALLKRTITGPNVMQSPWGWHVRPDLRGSSAADIIRVVYLKKVSGAAGDADDAPTWAYDLYAATDVTMPAANLIVEAQQPIFRPTVNGTYAEADDGSVGLAVFVAGEWRLLLAGLERLDTEACEGT